MKVVNVETFEEVTGSSKGRRIYRKTLEDSSKVLIGCGEFTRLWYILTGHVYPDHPEITPEEQAKFDKFKTSFELKSSLTVFPGICCNTGLYQTNDCKGCKQ